MSYLFSKDYNDSINSYHNMNYHKLSLPQKQIPSYGYSYNTMGSSSNKQEKSCIMNILTYFVNACYDAYLFTKKMISNILYF